jgi:hypothetical protein
MDGWRRQEVGGQRVCQVTRIKNEANNCYYSILRTVSCVRSLSFPSWSGHREVTTISRGQAWSSHSIEQLRPHHECVLTRSRTTRTHRPRCYERCEKELDCGLGPLPLKNSWSVWQLVRHWKCIVSLWEQLSEVGCQKGVMSITPEEGDRHEKLFTEAPILR